MNRILQWLAYLVLRMLAELIRLLPFSLGVRATRPVGRFLYLILKRYRLVALDNLRQAFGDEKTEAEIRKIAMESFENLAVFGFEFIYTPKMARHFSRYIRLEGFEQGGKLLEKGNGLVFIVSHFGNWEWLAVAGGMMDYPLHAVARPLKNPFVYRYVKKMRGLKGLKVIDKRGAVRRAFEVIDRNEMVCVLIDQHERQGSVKVPFFGRDAWTPTLPAVLALRKNTPIQAVFLYRDRRLPYRAVVSEPFQVIETGDYARDLYENTKQYVASIESAIRSRPGEWLWMHRRWR